jgi:hypothetical protein
MIGCLINNELERIWNVATVVYFKIVSRRLPRETEENHKVLIQDCLSPGRHTFAPGTSRIRKVLTTRDVRVNGLNF